jgi:hypothetical protein
MKRWQWILLGLVTVLSLLGQYLGHDDHHDAGWWEQVPGFWAIYGFVGCVLIIVGSKAIGGILLQRKEDYFDEP